MSKENVPGVMRRVRAAEPNSPIAVFKEGRDLNVVFANTVYAMNCLRSGKYNLVGVFDKTMNMRDIRQDLREIVG